MDNNKKFEQNVRFLAKRLKYPPTPNLSWESINLQQIGMNTWSWVNLKTAAAIVILFLAVLFAVPGVRARILDFILVGSVDIILPSTKEQIQERQSDEGTLPSPMIGIRDPGTNKLLEGETTLSDAQTMVDFKISIPEINPTDQGPSHIFIQDVGTGKFVILAWTQERSGEIILVQYILGPEVRLSKGPVAGLNETSVNGNYAVWTTGPYLVSLEGGIHQPVFWIVNGHALIWERDGLTYRLETHLSIEEAVNIAESIP